MDKIYDSLNVAVGYFFIVDISTEAVIRSRLVLIHKLFFYHLGLTTHSLYCQSDKNCLYK